MPWSTDYRVSNIEYVGVDPPNDTVIIGGVTSNSIAANANILRQVANNSIHAREATLNGLTPVGRFVTTDAQNALKVFGLSGFCFEAPIHNYFQLQGCKGPEAGSVHIRYRVEEGIVVPITLSVDHQGDVQITYEIRVRWDGTANPPVVQDTGVPIPAAAGADLKYTMNKMELPNITNTAPIGVTGKTNITINFNTTTQGIGADSEIFDRIQSLDSSLPTTTITGLDMNWFEEEIMDLIGKKTNVGDVVIWFAQRNAALTDTVHFQIAQQGYMYWNDVINGTIGQPANSTFAIDSIESQDGVTKPLTPTYDIAIT